MPGLVYTSETALTEREGEIPSFEDVSFEGRSQVRPQCPHCCPLLFLSLSSWLYGVAESWTRLSDFTFTFHFHALEKEMATHSSVLAWRIPGMGEPGGLPSMGSHRVRHDWSDLAAAAAEALSRHLSKSYHCFGGTMFSPAVFCPQLEWMVKSEWVTCLNRKCSWVTPPSGPGVNILTLFDP